MECEVEDQVREATGKDLAVTEPADTGSLEAALQWTRNVAKAVTKKKKEEERERTENKISNDRNGSAMA